MRIALLCLFAASSAIAQQPPCVQITQTLYAVGGARPVLMNGTINLYKGDSSPDGSFVVVESEAPIRIVSGRLNTCLAPGSYQADYSVSPQPGATKTTEFTRYWTVPPTGGPYALPDVEGSSSVTPETSFPLTGITTSAPDGDYCVRVASGRLVLMVACPGGGSSGPSTLASLTNSQLSSLTNSQLSGMTN